MRKLIICTGKFKRLCIVKSDKRIEIIGAVLDCGIDIAVVVAETADVVTASFLKSFGNGIYVHSDHLSGFDIGFSEMLVAAEIEICSVIRYAL